MLAIRDRERSRNETMKKAAEMQEQRQGANEEVTTVEFRTETPEMFEFVLQEGFQVSCVDNCSIREFLCLQLELCGDYTEKNIQTIFLNGKSVDGVDTATLRENDILALSAAMPGLVGAAMRKQGFFAKMRHSISHEGEADNDIEEEGKPCLVTVKLFNLLSRDLARDFLRHGLRFPMERFRTLIERRPKSFFSRLNEVIVNNERLRAPMDLAGSLPPSPGTVQLRLLEMEGC